MGAPAQLAPRNDPYPGIERIELAIIARGNRHDDGEPLRVIE
jgi:hypothetical protein